MRYPFLFVSIPLLVAACKTSSPDKSAAPPESIAGHCVYMNPFSKAEECREYHGDAWTEAAVAEDCRAQGSEPQLGACGYKDTLGSCVLKGEPNKVTHLIFPGDDASKCSSLKLGCEVFAGGAFAGAGACEGDTDDAPSDPNATVFIPPTLICSDPLPGEPVGQSEGGKVCTWQMISGSTEPGRRFIDYASCDVVRTQRPYHPVAPSKELSKPDARMEDPAYVAELAWVKEQVEASACTCCHQGSVTPKGAAVWDIESEGNWVNGFSPYGLAFAVGAIDSSLLGAYPASENNGFSREKIGIPTTDIPRMKAFFKKELEHRGYTVEDYADWNPVPEVFYQMSIYEPTMCQGGEGVSADLTVRWAGGRARYVYVMAADAANPGVPPNLDLPEGTLWRVDVPPDAEALASGELRFGELPKGMKQGFPASGSPKGLEPGKTYYLYAAADVMAPVTRCLFTFAGK